MTPQNKCGIFHRITWSHLISQPITVRPQPQPITSQPQPITSPELPITWNHLTSQPQPISFSLSLDEAIRIISTAMGHTLGNDAAFGKLHHARKYLEAQLTERLNNSELN